MRLMAHTSSFYHSDAVQLFVELVHKVAQKGLIQVQAAMRKPVKNGEEISPRSNSSGGRIRDVLWKRINY
jgi:hypothetical protein